MQTRTFIKKLKELISFIPEGYGISLGNDTFLCEGGEDGSDKIYGFKNVDGDLLVETRDSTDGYPISEMVRSDLQYIFELSDIGRKLENKAYKASALNINNFIT